MGVTMTKDSATIIDVVAAAVQALGPVAMAFKATFGV